MDEAFHNYLRRSKDVVIDAGLQATMNQTEMNVFVTALEELDMLALAVVVIVPISAGVVVILIVFIKRRQKLNKNDKKNRNTHTL